MAVRDRYGRTQFGQCCLLARRLAEAGVPIINVHYCRTPTGSWDTHGKHFTQMKESLCPTFDRGCYGCYGPMETPNTASLTSQFRILGQSDSEISRMFRGFNAWSWQFRKASEECERA